ncbi:hypothetical protein [Chitinivorax sp. B]|uniref:hypothetical protein n=1 Tax=Chitinivorax sp. B TaxID=2502235 RepID=UPI0010F75197|nr:hypothetical protein [Chitinivorax sp. B]
MAKIALFSIADSMACYQCAAECLSLTTNGTITIQVFVMFGYYVVIKQLLGGDLLKDGGIWRLETKKRDLGHAFLFPAQWLIASMP